MTGETHVITNAHLAIIGTAKSMAASRPGSLSTLWTAHRCRLAGRPNPTVIRHHSSFEVVETVARPSRKKRVALWVHFLIAAPIVAVLIFGAWWFVVPARFYGTAVLSLPAAAWLWLF